MASSFQIKFLKNLIFLYLILLLLEGGLRKWWLPGLSTPLLIVRDPLVIVIYMVAASSRRLVINGFVAACLLLAMASFCASFLDPQTNIIVSLIGLRCYFLHLPLIFVMGKTLDEEDIQLMGKFLFWFVIPETFLVVDQFYAPQSAKVNHLIGNIVGEGMTGANGHFRPSGTFSFTTGVGQFYPMVLAALLSSLLNRQKLPSYLSISAGVCVAFGVFFSLSRTNAVTCAIILMVAGSSIFVLPNAPKMIMRSVLLAGLVMLAVSWLPRFDDGLEAFESRWALSTGQEAGGVRTAIVGRALGSLVPPAYVFEEAPVLGYGVGSGTNMAQAYLGGMTFVFGEDEYQRLIYEMGPILGLSFILLRVALCLYILKTAFSAIQRGNVTPALYAVEASLLVLNAQWAQPTTLGFATFCAGMVFASARTSTVKSKSARRYSYKPQTKLGELPPEASPQS